MSSNRWKRFAFFDRSNLSLSEELQKELNLPNNSTQAKEEEDEEESACLDYSMAISSCSYSTIIEYSNAKRRNLSASTTFNNLLPNVMNVSALVSQTLGTSAAAAAAATSSQHAESSENQYVYHTLIQNKQFPCVFLFVSSQYTNKVYCFDVSLICNDLTSDEKEEQDCYRGFFIPFDDFDSKTTTNSTNHQLSAEERIINDHLNAETKRLNDSSVVSCITNMTCCSSDDDLYLAISSKDSVIVHKNPHLMLLLEAEPTFYKSTSLQKKLGTPTNITMIPGYVAIGTTTGHVILYSYTPKSNRLIVWMELQPPSNNISINNVQLVSLQDKILLFVTYNSLINQDRPIGICCYELGNKTFNARFDLDTYYLNTFLPLSSYDTSTNEFVVAKSDGIYYYTTKQHTHILPLDGAKTLLSCIPCNFLLLSSKQKNKRNALDIYDVSTKLIAFHLLLSPAQFAIQAEGFQYHNNTSCSVVLTSNGTLLFLKEKSTHDKVTLLLQKNLYTAAISLAYKDTNYPRNDISTLYRNHAEFLYKKGDYEAAMEQYIFTINMSIVEPSHVIYRYLDSTQKIPLLIKYLEAFKRENLDDTQLQLLKACYLKCNNVEQADKITDELDWRRRKLNSAVATTNIASISSLPHHDPLEAFKTISAMEAPQAAQALQIHGCTLARALPRETAGIVLSLCDGTYSPNNLASVSTSLETQKKIKLERTCEKYPVDLFAMKFLENPKLLRLILAHVYRNKCVLKPSLKRTLLELTLEEWKEAKYSRVSSPSTTNTEKIRANEAMILLSDTSSTSPNELEDDYESLVIVQNAKFTQGEILLYERLQIMSNLLLEQYAKDGSDRARRQMLAICKTDPELLADVLGYFIVMAEHVDTNDSDKKDNLSNDENTQLSTISILEDIQEALYIAKQQGVLSPVRIARILAGENTHQFSSEKSNQETINTNVSVPLSVALDYIGGILDDSSKKITKLKSEIEEYNTSCDIMEAEIASLLHPSSSTATETTSDENVLSSAMSRINIEEMYDILSMEETSQNNNVLLHTTITEQEAFWREMDQSEDRFEIITRFFGKGLIP